MSSEWVNYFGYGSLVNRDTRPKQESAVNITLKGWQRVWNHRVSDSDGRQRCTSLSIEPAEAQIDGVLVRIPLKDLPDLDRRELGYQRLELPVDSFIIDQAALGEINGETNIDTVYVYQSLEENRNLADDQHPLTQSYADCVMAGYLARFDDAGLQRLLHTTRGWERPMLNDRHQPTYPRSITLPSEKQQQFDALLNALRA